MRASAECRQAAVVSRMEHIENRICSTSGGSGVLRERGFEGYLSLVQYVQPLLLYMNSVLT